MSEMPHAARPFVTFPSQLRAKGFLASPEQTASFLAAIELLGPRHVGDIRRAAHATFAPPPDRSTEFDALFDAHFLSAVATVIEHSEADRENITVRDSERGTIDVPLTDDTDRSGRTATLVERLTARQFGPQSENEILRSFMRALPDRLPRRRGYRRRVGSRGKLYELRRSLREAVKNDGEVMNISRLRRRTRQRRVLLLIDVSGSMKERTDAHLNFAHALASATERFEGFTIGTRLTRVTKALRIKNRDRARVAASTLVADWDGGTRIGDALQAFLAMPRFASYARGALVLIVSDGLERGDPAAMQDAVARLAALAWRVSWLSPLGSDPRFQPETDAIKSILPLVQFADGGTTERLCSHVLSITKSTSARAAGLRRRA
jgi:uncharacterized protein